jgi:hypothetical protein
MTREELEAALRRVVLREDEMLAEAGVVLEEITAADEGEMKEPFSHEFEMHSMQDNTISRFPHRFQFI